jgi:hypothetical protein
MFDFNKSLSLKLQQGHLSFVNHRIGKSKMLKFQYFTSMKFIMQINYLYFSQTRG